MTTLVQIEHRGPVSQLRLCRTEARNALDTALLQALDAAIAEVAGHTATRVVIVSGQDRAFCSGADLEYLGTQAAEGVQAFCALGTAVLDRLASLPLPTIAAVDGLALGGGFELALSCDMIVATSSSVLGLPEVQIGAIPSFGGVRRLSRRVSPSLARELVYTGRTLTAAKARELGLVLDVVKAAELADYCEQLATRIARNAPLALAAAKRLFIAGELGDRDAAQLAELELREAQQLGATSDWREGLSARRDKRSPVFERK